MNRDQVCRRDFLKSCVIGSAGALLASCGTGPRKVASLAPPPSSRKSKAHQATPSLGPGDLVHEVKASETIWYLSQTYGVPEEAIYKANRLKPGCIIEIGQKLVIPAGARAASSAILLPRSEVIFPPPSLSPVTAPQTHITPLQIPLHSRRIVHEVGPLETVWRISRMYDVSEAAIHKANGIKPGAPIRIGQKLVIPNAKVFHNVIPIYPGRKWRYILVHHTATDRGNACLINRSHRFRGFWHGLGYHFLIDNGTLGKADGQIEASPRWIKQQNGAHCKAGGMNSKGIGIGLVGNFSEGLPTQKQLRSLIYLTKALRQTYSIPPQRVLPHRGVAGASTECPGTRFPWSTLEMYACRT